MTVSKIRPLMGKLLGLKKQIFNFYYPNFFAIKNKRLTFSKAPVCDQLLCITGVGKIRIGNKCMFGYKPGGHHQNGTIELQARTINASIEFGNNVVTNNNLFICSCNKVVIGSDTLIGEHVTIMDFEAHGIAPDKRRNLGEIGEVLIGNNVWIGNNVTILKNTIIGDNTIIATGAVVSGNFPDNVIIGGVPAKIIKSL